MRSLLLSRRWLVRHAVAIVLIGICLGLAWWQWGRAHSLTGTAQNLGYALQWPAFAAFVGYFWYRMLRLELRGPDEPADTAPADHPPARTVPVRRSYRPPAPVPGAEPDDDRLAAYNAYLASLNDRAPHQTEETTP